MKSIVESPQCDAVEPMPAGFGSKLAEVIGTCGVVRKGEPLSRRTTLRVGGAAEFYVEPSEESVLCRVIELCGQHHVPIFVLGRGSNLLVRDGGIRGVVLSLAAGAFARIERDENRVWCGAGCRLKDVAQSMRRYGLSGFEFFEGIPGGIGGALRMNAGAMGSATFDRLVKLRTVDRGGNVRERLKAEIQVGYRHCPLLHEEIALGAWFEGVPDDPERIRERMDVFNRKRWESQPPQPSAGCIFKNPAEGSAGKWIDELGLKGMRVGGASVSQVHGNFIVNDKGARASEVLELIEKVRQEVRSARGVELQTEVEIVGVDAVACVEPGGSV